MATFDVFLSHNTRDKAGVRKLFAVLEERGLRPWLAEKHLVPGRDWQKVVEELIATVPAAAVLIGSDGIGPWEKMEMRAALAEYVRRELPVIPVLLWEAPRQPQLPLFLQVFTWVDLRGGQTEEGIDLLVWGITGEKPPAGKILAPKSRAQVPQVFTVEGSLSTIPPLHHVRIAVQSSGLLWPKEPELPAQDQRWTLQVRESGPGKRFALSLLLVNATGQKQISRWLDDGQKTGDYPGFTSIPGSISLHEVRELVLK
jgi:hypothetical protein